MNQRVSTMFFMACLAAALVVAAWDVVLKPAYHRVAFDDSAPIRFLDAHLETNKLRVGAPEIRFSFTYSDKRAACHPPMAEAGLIRFRIWTGERDWVWLRFENRSYAPSTGSSSSSKTMPFRSIPIPPLAPGRYIFQWVATYNCAGSSGPISVESPKLPFEVI